jgi:hypothetical protein
VNAKGGLGRAVWSAKKIKHTSAAHRIALFSETPGYITSGHQLTAQRNLAVGALRDSRGVEQGSVVFPFPRRIAENKVLTGTDDVMSLRQWLTQHAGCSGL